MKTLVIGASPNPSRFSHKVVKLLKKNNIEVIPFGQKKGQIINMDIINTKQFFDNIHSIILYLSAANQQEYYDYILSLKPKRVIFNPGTYNQEFIDILKNEDIEVVADCVIELILNGEY